MTLSWFFFFFFYIDSLCGIFRCGISLFSMSVLLAEEKWKEREEERERDGSELYRVFSLMVSASPFPHVHA